MVDTTPDHLKQGKQAEQAALEYLVQYGCELILKNYSIRQGEIDLIMRDNQDLVFVEVRYRQNQKFGGAIESIDNKKQASITTAAQHFLQQNPDLMFKGCRFDVVLLSGQSPHYEYDWIKAAF